MDDTQNRAGQATHTVYLLTINGKPYVGQAADYHRRKADHLRTLRNGIHFSPHIQAAYDKYGPESVCFEILETGVPSALIDDRECYWIDFYDSHGNGLNHSKGGIGAKPFSKPFTWNGIEYPSQAAAARALGISPSAVRARTKAGYACDADIPLPGEHLHKPVTWNGIEYESMREAAVKTGHGDSFWYYIKRGYTCDQDVRPFKKAIVWNGQTYPSIKAAAAAVGITPGSLSYRIRNGHTCDADLKKPRKVRRIPITWNEVKYPSITEAAQALGVSQHTMRWRVIERGYTCDRDMLTHRHKST